MRWSATAGFVCFLLLAASDAVPQEPRASKEALQAFNDLIGKWNGIGNPVGTLEQKQKGFWTESISFGWQFKGNDAWLVLNFDKSKHFTSGELRWIPDKKEYALQVKTTAKDTQVFQGPLDKKTLTLEREATGETQRLVFTLLHDHRFLYRYEVRPEGKGLFSKKWTVGANRDGVAFASGDGRPECVVSGGVGTTPVSYMGRTYYVCCSGCRDEFQQSPQKYVDEYEAKKAKKK